MGGLKRPLTPLVLLAAAIGLCAIAATALAAATGPPGVKSQMASTLATDASPPGGQGGYAGQETCLGCHEGMDASLIGTRHYRAIDGRTPMANNGCESCHGPGLEHAETGDPDLMVSFAERTPNEANETCTSCHNTGAQAFWLGSQHEGRDVTCNTCHSVHSPKSDEAQLALNTATETCAQCHSEKVAKIQRTTHMPLREGSMECSSCHNPHGAVNDRMLGEGFTINESCTTSCHAEKRGPFMFEHAPVVENCATCHDSHGSVNDRMLTAKVPMLCQRCHNHTRHPPRVYDAVGLTSRTQGYQRSCINCHQAIHGTNHASGKRLLR